MTTTESTDLLNELRRQAEENAALYVTTGRALARRLGVGLRTLPRIIESNPDFPPRRIVLGIRTPVWIWSEVEEWARARPKEFE